MIVGPPPPGPGPVQGGAGGGLERRLLVPGGLPEPEPGLGRVAKVLGRIVPGGAIRLMPVAGALILLPLLALPLVVFLVRAVRAWSDPTAIDGLLARATANSLAVALSSVLLAGVLGTGLALHLRNPRRNLPEWVRLAGLAPLLLPALPAAAGFSLAFGPDGLLGGAVAGWLGFGGGSPLRLLISFHTFLLTGYFFAIVSLGILRSDPGRHDAMRAYGPEGRVGQAFAMVRSLRSWVGAAAAVALTVSLGSLAGPLLLAPEFPVLTTSTFLARQAGMDTGAWAGGGALLALSVLVLGSRALRPVGPRSGALPRPDGPGGSTRTTSGGPRALWRRFLPIPLPLLPVVAALLLPHVALIASSLGVGAPGIGADGPPILGLVTDPDARGPIWTSIRTAAAAAVTVVGLGAMIGLAAVRDRGRLAGVVRGVAMVPILVPGVVLGLAMAGTFSESGGLSGSWHFGGFGLLVASYIVLALPVGVSVIGAAAEGVDALWEDASRALGSTPARTWRALIWPILRSPLLLVATVVFALSLGEFDASMVVFAHADRPASVEMWLRLQEGHIGPAAALGTALLAVSTAAWVFVLRALRSD